jgi:hypothetical protein
MDGTLPDDMIQEKLAQIRMDRAAAQSQVSSISENVRRGADNIQEILRFLGNPGAWYNHPLATEKAKKRLNAAIFEKIYTHYDQTSRQAEARHATYSDGIQQLKTMEERFNRTGTLEPLQPELDATGQDTINRLTRTCQPSAYQTGDNTSDGANTLDTFTRTRNPETPQNTDKSIKPEQNQP